MSNSTPLHFQEVLDKKRLDVLPDLIFFTEKGFYLAGGTALALQYGHRESIDFDFFIRGDIDTAALFSEILNYFSEYEVTKMHEEKNTLYVEINGIKISCISYHYALLEETIYTGVLSLASKRDIACMKMWAIQNRATNKDYVDLYYLLQEFPLEDILQSFYAKFGEGIVSENYLRKSLVFFEDIELEDLKLHHDLVWEDVVSGLEKIVFSDYK